MRFLVYVLVVFVCIVSVSAQQFYVPMEIPEVGGYGAREFLDLNNLGQAVGYAQGDGFQNVVLYNSQLNTVTNVANPDGYVYGFARAINDKGIIVGSVTKEGENLPRAFLLDGGWNVFGEYRSWASDINNSNMVTGEALTESENYHQAFLYSNGELKLLGNLHEDNNLGSSGQSINDSGVVVGRADYQFSWSGNPYRAFRYKNGEMEELVPYSWGSATSVNNKGNVVGTYGNRSYVPNSFLYSAVDESVVDLPKDPEYESINATDINDSDQVVGDLRRNTGPYSLGFLYQNGVTHRIDDFMIPNSEFDLVTSVKSINDPGQILAIARRDGQYKNVILQPLMQNPASFAGLNIKDNAYRRLGLWNGKEFVDLPKDFVIDGNTNVHVVTHGWAPGFKNGVFNDDGSFRRVWDEVEDEDGNTYGDWVSTQASVLAHEDAGSVVLGYSWVDQSATSTNLTPWQSRAHTDDNGNLLAWLLEDVIGESFAGKIQLLGHSHGSRVVTTSALALEKAGINVDHLTLWDAPESGKPFVLGGKVYLAKHLAQLGEKYGIGNGENETFVENYFSQFGWAYNDDVVNVELLPEHLDGLGGIMSLRHGYSTGWYANASLITDDVAFNWFDDKPEAGTSWYQDWLDGNGDPDFSREYVLTEGTYVPKKRILQTTALGLLPFWSQNVSIVDQETGDAILEEHSPAFWYGTLLVSEEDIAFQFEYEFLNIGDGDQLGVWIDEELAMLITGDLVGTGVQLGDIDLSGLDPRIHFLTFALYSTGEENAQISIGKFQMISVPEPATLFLAGAGIAVAIFRRK